LNLVKLTNEYKLDIVKEDPVRPHLHKAWRVLDNREVLALETDGKIDAVICVAYTDEVAESERDLQRWRSDEVDGSIAMFYTVWAYTQGSGRILVKEAARRAKEKGATRFITLSPLTPMAERFHTRNGAKLIAKHSDCQNFEYTLDNN
jgi:GNAT superfamily N-acetyltransferase